MKPAVASKGVLEKGLLIVLNQEYCADLTIRFESRKVLEVTKTVVGCYVRQDSVTFDDDTSSTVHDDVMGDDDLDGWRQGLADLDQPIAYPLRRALCRRAVRLEHVQSRVLLGRRDLLERQPDVVHQQNRCGELPGQGVGYHGLPHARTAAAGENLPFALVIYGFHGQCSSRNARSRISVRSMKAGASRRHSGLGS